MRTIDSLAEGFERTVRIHVGAEPHDDDGPPSLLVAQDGQNLFDAGPNAMGVPWGLDTTIDELAREGRVGRWVVAAVDHREHLRIGDYAPWPDRRRADGARGEAYARFVTDELVPLLAAEFDVPLEPERVAILGSSMGGLIALYVGASRPDRVGRVGALSPTSMWANGEIVRWWTRRHGRGLRIYLDAGRREVFRSGSLRLNYRFGLTRLADHLRGLGYEEEEELRVVIDEEGDHSEGSWRRRLPDALEWLLG